MDDVISRQDTINEIKNVFDDILCCNVSVRKGLPEAVRRIEMMPSAEPKTKCIAQIRINRDDMEDLVNKKVNEIVDKMVEPKKGAWGAHGECPYCGYLRQWDDDNFCANCGANMRGDTA